MKWFSKSSKLTKFLFRSLSTFLMLILISIGLPAPFLLLNFPSFTIGDGDVWILSWQNNTDGFSIRFNFVALLVIALILSLVSLVFVGWRDRSTPDS